MTDTPISQAEITALAGKLDALTPVQKAMLSAITTLAAEAVAGTAAPADEREVPVSDLSFSQQFAVAFEPEHVQVRTKPDGTKAVTFKISR